MNSIQKRQRGASSLATIIVLALLGVAVYIGLQYIPQLIESGTVDGVLSDVKKAHALKPSSTLKDVQEMIAKSLYINQMEDMRKNFTVADSNDEFLVKVAYDRELNLIYTRKAIDYRKSLTLRKRSSDQ
mgnify:CR=1 FL=1